MGGGQYTDSGQRFRYNDYLRQDGWLIPKYIHNPFFDYSFYSSDTYPSPPESNEYLIAEIYFRLGVDQITHSRDVYFFINFIGDIGGVTGLLLKISGFIIGGYTSFHSIFTTISSLYKVKHSGENLFLQSKIVPSQNEDLHKIQKIKLPLSTRIFLYLLSTPLKIILKVCKKDKHVFFEEVLQSGKEKVHSDFDI